jgi:two-component system chemotaxis response regulator CheY
MKRILVVDDAATVRLYHRTILEREGHHVEEAVNGIEALEKSLAESFSLFLVDVNMPPWDGYGFLQRLREADVAFAPAIMISTEAAPEDEAKAYRCGANAYIVKPARPEALLATVKVLLGEPVL